MDSILTDGGIVTVNSQRIGYVRVSSLDQNPDRQLEQIAVDRTFTDKASGKESRRPQLDALLRFRARGTRWSCIPWTAWRATSTTCAGSSSTLTGRGIRVEFVKEGLTFTGEDAPMATLLLSVMGAFAEFERALIGERQREGIALAKRRGVYRGRKKALSVEQRAEARIRVAAGERKAAVARAYGISRETLYQYLRTME